MTNPKARILKHGQTQSILAGFTFSASSLDAVEIQTGFLGSGLLGVLHSTGTGAVVETGVLLVLKV
jgi:altronate dehydratase